MGSPARCGSCGRAAGACGDASCKLTVSASRVPRDPAALSSGSLSHSSRPGYLPLVERALRNEFAHRAAAHHTASRRGSRKAQKPAALSNSSARRQRGEKIQRGIVSWFEIKLVLGAGMPRRSRAVFKTKTRHGWLQRASAADLSSCGHSCGEFEIRIISRPVLLGISKPKTHWITDFWCSYDPTFAGDVPDMNANVESEH